ncbi:MAG: hypothetical protein RIF36_11615 [Imperialibacter sp.]|uniref:hypothetical protein n=1 Tax=Imperialibacter sp. TaxID=2038411 RepID=UPI0032EF2D64
MNLEYIIALAEAKTNFKTDTVKLCELYVLDGIPYTSAEEFEKELEPFNRADIRLATIADLSNSEIYCRICDYVLLVGTAKNQSTKYKAMQLHLFRTNLNENLPELIITDYNCEKCQQLVVDGIPVEPFKARELVNELRPKDIQFIVSYQSANPEIYGRNAVNGLTEIFLK